MECVPRVFGFVRPNSRRYHEVFEATVDAKEDASSEMPEGPLVEHPTYRIPTRVLSRKDNNPQPAVDSISARVPHVTVVTATPNETGKERPTKLAPTEQDLQERGPAKSATQDEKRESDQSATQDEKREPGKSATQDEKLEPDESATKDGKADPTEVAGQFSKIARADGEADDMVFFHEGSELFAEELEREMAMLPDVPLTAEVQMEDLKVGRPTGVTTEEGVRACKLSAQVHEELRGDSAPSLSAA
jgi:hypothetical protein